MQTLTHSLPSVFSLRWTDPEEAGTEHKDSYTTIYDITPVAKPRMTSSDRWRGQPGRPPMRPCVARYRAFADEIRARGVQLPESGASVLFILPMPKSWSQKKRKDMVGKPHQLKRKNDLDNLIKSLADAIYGDDSCIWQYRGLEKRWGYKGQIIIQVEDRG